MRPRRLIGASGRPSNFTVRPLAKGMRKIQKQLWDEVSNVVCDIKRYSDEGNTQMEAVCTAALRAIYARQNVLGAPDPALTEAVADFTEDASEAVGLYRLALAQSSRYRGEPTHTKRICMASRLIELGELRSARVELIQGRAEAEQFHDAHYVEFADQLLSKLAV